jgi:ACT domain-containing protein
MCSDDIKRDFLRAVEARRRTWMIDWIVVMAELDNKSSNLLTRDFRGHRSLKKVRDVLSKLQTKMVRACFQF